MNREQANTATPIFVVIFIIVMVVVSSIITAKEKAEIYRLEVNEREIERALSKKECTDNNGIYFKATHGADNCVFKP